MRAAELKWRWLEGTTKTGYRSKEEIAALREYLLTYHKFPDHGFSKDDRRNWRRSFNLDNSYR